MSIPISNIGQSARGLAYSRKRGTFFTIGADGNSPYVLFEINPNGQIVRNWKALNADGTLNVVGSFPRMPGLWIDEQNQDLYCSFGSFYSGANNNSVYRINLDTEKKDGPYKTDIHSDLVKGSYCGTPCPILRATGYKFMAFGHRSSTGQSGSWGPGLILIEDFTPSPQKATQVIHWPIIPSPMPSRSDYPRPFPAQWITGPASNPVYQTFYHFQSSDGFSHLGYHDDWITYLVSWAEGWSWYGNPLEYTNLPSLLNPSKQTISINSGTGTHFERLRYQLAFIHQDTVIGAFKSGFQRVEASHYQDLPINNKFITGKVVVDNTIHVLTTGGLKPTLEEFQL
jgi:hypothetical protein